MDVVNDLHMGGSTSTEDVNLSQKRKMPKRKKQGNAVECEGPDFSLDNSSPKMDATINHPLDESPALPNFLSCQIIVEFNSTKQNEKGKRKKTTHNPIEGNNSSCGTSENTFSSKASTPALDMLSGLPIQCFSTDPITSQSCEELGFCQGDDEEKEQKMIDTTAAKASSPAMDMLSGHPIQCFSSDPITSQSYEEAGFCQGDHEEKEQKMINTTAEKHHNVPEVSGNHIFVAASPEPFAKKCVPEVVKFNIEHSINDNISNLEDKNSFVNDTSLMKEDVDDPADYDLSDKSMCYKACQRRQMVNADCRSSGYPSPESPNNEPTFQDHDKDDSHKFSDGSLRVGLMGVETKLSIDQVASHSGDAAEGIKLSTDIINEQRFMTNSIVDIPVEHLKADGRQLDNTEITRSDLCCAGEQIELNTENINEQRSMTTSSAVDIHVEQRETNGRQLDHAEITRNDLCCAGDVSDLSLDTVRDGHLKISQFSLDRSVSGNRKKKLLILDVNGLLADFVSVNVTRTRYRREPEPDFVLKGKKVYKRPFCEDFLQFCFDRFHVGVWSSRAKSNVHEAIKFLLGKSASKLLFCWNQSHCTTTEFTTVENIYKPLVLKELRKLWEKEEPDLPWEKGEFNESNTLLLDDSPYKALMNPMHSAIFPYSYLYYNTRDSELGPGGDLRVYLEGLAVAENVRNYVSENPFGQRPIREANPSWGYYRRVIESVQRSQKARPSSTG
ncbi:hypothetical protein PHAVU_009G202400 [Phaseolus vulgaris]|uniref:FCP1 homology domain-containing protein n=2 Tax=Phaseolus vulgaris TaxID=3885 RepID=V7B1L6_PHAVU|nr:hypothetical protein PHAVU_009G202400g [Phaseolus vulgaris]XP_007138362.1 hypothetical protein PHAVU_009G202400g [Phaseolus vulgaris]XP_007138364.1 hypothetical protein PHAVU_009G202400g [Phaseolus vulgaris]ESW10355.1 hypothetical protein PHAVU_009G202400g [Phaseolus vulgaris]ESW10356.1 hypothetical protein PHAVU_009G202400g [Phaseolus vulgaris]ESW10358.1 hypothetical protein PHAVU_009G202400g [Phaseolus vulgaris]